MSVNTNVIKEEDIDSVWQKFFEIKENNNKYSLEYTETRNKLIDYYYPMVSQIARSMLTRLKDITEDELISFGVDGLFHAVEGFDPSKEVKFKTYASHRIKGSILDNIRKADWMPRLARKRHSEIENIRHRCEAELGRNLTDTELAERMGLSLEDYQKLVRKSTPINQVSMDTRSRGRQEEEHETLVDFAASEFSEPLDTVLQDEMFKKLLSNNFTPLEKKIVFMHYYEDLNLQDIAKKTGFSETRISQIHSDILRRLRGKIKRNPQYFEEVIAYFNV